MWRKMSDEERQEKLHHDLAAAGLEALESMEKVLEMLDGYRAMLKKHGYSESAAELMVVQMHGTLLGNGLK